MIRDWIREITETLRNPKASTKGKLTKVIIELVMAIDGVYLVIVWVFFTLSYIITKVPPGEYRGFVLLGLPISLFISAWILWIPFAFA